MFFFCAKATDSFVLIEVFRIKVFLQQEVSGDECEVCLKIASLWRLTKKKSNQFLLGSKPHLPLN